MAYTVSRLCRDCKDTACVAVCPVDCFYVPKNVDDAKQLYNMLYISPAECIDCGACEPECPWEAIFEASGLPSKFEEDAAINELCDSARDSFETAKQVEGPHPTPEQVKANKIKWGLS